MRCTGSLPGVTDEAYRGSVARYVWDLADRDASGWVVPLGADGRPGHAHHLDQLPLWAAGELVPLVTDWARLTEEPDVSRDVVPLREATRAWFAISLQTFGGPAGQIAVMQRTLVEERRWIGQQRFLFALSYCTLLPGPEATQLATYIGWLLNGIRGALIAGILFILPGVVALLALSAIYVTAGETTLVEAVFLGLAPAVIAIVIQAVVRLGSKGLTHPSLIGLAVASFAALSLFAVPFPAVVATAAVIGWLLGRAIPTVTTARSTPADAGPPPLISDDALHTERPSGQRSALIAVTGLVLWAAPVVVAGVALGRASILCRPGSLLLRRRRRHVRRRLRRPRLRRPAGRQRLRLAGTGEMVRGLALAETTPGPLIMVVQFVAFVGAYRSPGSLDPWVAAVLAALLTTWVTFVPCFLFILLGAPYVERLRGNRGLTSALTGITAAVVGVIANLALYFALHTLFDDTRRIMTGPLSFEVPQLDSIQWAALAITGLGCLLTFRLRWSVLRTLGACALAGVVVGLAQAL